MTIPNYWTNIQVLNDNVLQEVSSYLNAEDFTALSMTNKRFNAFFGDKVWGENIASREKDKWTKYYGNINTIPRVPFSALTFLKGPSVLDSTRKASSDFKLFWMPKEINKEPHTINNFEKYAKNAPSRLALPNSSSPLSKGACYDYIDPKIVQSEKGISLGDTPVEKGYWYVISTKIALHTENNKDLRFEQQENRVTNWGKQYSIAKVIEVTTSSLRTLTESKKQLCPEKFPDRFVFSRCKEKIAGNQVIISELENDITVNARPYMDVGHGVNVVVKFDPDKT